MVYKNYKAELLGKYLFYSQYTVVKQFICHCYGFTKYSKVTALVTHVCSCLLDCVV